MTTTSLTAITMPQLGESVTEGTIGAWLRNIGDRIEKYDPLVEIESDKASSELPSPLTGTLVEILIDPGTTVPVGTALCRIENVDAASLPPTPPTTHAHSAVTDPSPSTASESRSSIRNRGEIADEMTLLRARSSPLVRRTAEEFGIDISEINGTGVGGRVTKRDVMALVSSLSTPATDSSIEAQPAAVVPAVPAPRATTTHQPALLYAGDEVVPLTSMRRAIAENMVLSKFTAPHATVVIEVDMTPVVAWRTARKEEFRTREGIDLTYLPIVLRAVTLALRKHPRLNAVWDESRIIHRREVNLGVAVALEDGLVVPVIRNADRFSLTGLAHALSEMATRARSGSLTADDLTGGTFTVNNPGTFGSIVSTPILVQPQVAILSTEAIVKRPMVIDDMIGIRSMMNLSLSIDHRALDGLAATRFLQQVKMWLERFSGAE